MNQSFQHQATRKTRAPATPTVAPISLAIRAALAVSATMLTLCVPVASWATDTRSLAAASTAHVRHGDPGESIADFLSPVDLTVVAGYPLPTSVLPSFGLADIGSDDVSAIFNAGSHINVRGAEALRIVDVHDVTIVNGGDAFGINDSHPDIQTSTNIDASGYGTVIGIDEYGDDSSTIDNSTGINVGAHAWAGAATAYGVRNRPNYFSYIYNETSGSIVASARSKQGNATAVGAFGFDADASTVHNDGTISARAVANNGMANAIGVYSAGFKNADVINTGTIAATATGSQATAEGIINQSYLEATTTNSGSITVSVGGSLAPYGQYEAVATGVYTFASMYDAVVNNSGSVSVASTATAIIGATDGFLTAKAIGVRAANPSGNGEALISNSGDISASAVTTQGYASAWGAISQSGSYGYGDAEIDNGGSIYSSAKSDVGVSTTIGAYIKSGNAAVLVNHGDIYAISQGGRGYATVSEADAYATGVNVYGFGYGAAGASINNDGTIEAHASVVGGYTAVATALQISGSSATVNNAAGATIYATAESELFGIARSVGIEASAINNINVVNDGNIAAYSHAHAFANSLYGYTGASGATGIEATANFQGNVSVVNHGDISAHAVTDHGITFFEAGAGATGVQAYAKYNAVVENAGTISAISNSDVGIVSAYGVVGRGKYDTHLINDAGGSIIASATTGSLSTDQYGGRAIVMGVKAYGSTQAVIYNAGSIVSQAVAGADGGANEGHSIATAWGASIGAYSTDAAGSVINLGDTQASATAQFGYATSFGTYVRDITTDPSAVVVASTSNSGTIASTSTADYGTAQAVGTYMVALRQLYSVDCSSGTCQYPGTLTANGGVATLDNSGEISAVAAAHGGTGYAYGATVLGAFNSGITNSGHISAVVDADTARAVGALNNSLYGYATVQNSGSINAVATGDVVSASGVFIAGAYGNTNTGNMAVTVDNQGSLLAKATGATTAKAIGIEATGWKDDGIQIDNIGTISAAAYGTGASATAVSMISQGDSVLTNSGAMGAYSALLHNSGALTAVATAHGGTGYAYGTTVLGAFNSGITNSGHISAVVDADTARAIGALNNSLYGDATLQNSGSISAVATGGVASASGAFIAGAYGNTDTGNMAVTVDNQGSLLVKATGATTAKAIGIEATGWKDDGIQIDNSGTIAAAAYGTGATATAVSMISNGDNVLTNSGAMGAYGDGARIAVSSSDGSTATIVNTGSITGAIVTGDGDDILNIKTSGIWNVVGTSTDFGAGDDTISNIGTINLHNSSLTLGSFDALGNTFANSGAITASGANLINMGAANPNSFTNTGSVEFRNGLTGDNLTVAGNWAGSGTLGVDVDALHNASDKLHVVGNVAAGSVATVDVNLLTLPTTAMSSVTVADVTGNSTAGSFVLGDVHFNTNKSFLVVQGVSLNSVIDASNAHPDVFALGVAVTGLTDSGSLAAAFAPGVQSLMSSEVGTWRERMGVLDSQPRGGAGAWARAFSDSGTFHPTYIANNFGQGGNVAFDQHNSGQELGVDFGIADGFSVGLLLGKAQASQHLDGAGVVGQNKITADTKGVYATWIASGGFYLDASYREMSFDARLDSVVGESRATGKADAFNGELGWSWTLGDGLKLVPQLQYTHTTVNHVDTLTGALAGFTPRGGTSSRGRAGVLLSDDIVSGKMTWTPYASASAVREFDGDNGFTINNTFSGSTSTKGTSALVEGGLAMHTGKLSVFGGVNWQDGGALNSVVGGHFGLRYSW